jgi:hypothetical protein
MALAEFVLGGMAVWALWAIAASLGDVADALEKIACDDE